MRLTLLLCLLHGALSAQAPDTTRTARTIPVTDSVLRLPVDRASEMLPWMPGGGQDIGGAPLWHGTPERLLDRVTDGIRWAPALRSTGYLGYSPQPVLLEPDFNALDRADISSVGRSPGTFSFVTLGGGDHWRANGSGEGEGPLRADGGTGLSRFDGSVGGPLGGSFRIRAAGTLVGRRSAPTGVGYAATPYYVPTGIDTTMRFPDPSTLPDSIDALIQRFGPTSSIPYSPRSTADWAVRLDGQVGGARLWAHWLGTRVAERFFNYVDVANPLQAKGQELSGRDLAAGIQLTVTDGLRLEGSVSLQHERSESGPITSASEFDSRDPGLGLMLGGLDLRWDLGNFPVNDQLIANYRDNTPGSRRSPYDLENTAQYSLIDQYRNDAYGLYGIYGIGSNGFSEAGGPLGLLALQQDDRILLSAKVVRDLGTAGALTIGGEFVHHDIQHYSSFLTSQAFSDVWLATPKEQALTIDWVKTGTGWRFEVGARLDRFETGASRPYLLDTLASSPTQGLYMYFPRLSSYGKDSPTLQHFVPDAAHTALAPHFLLSGLFGEGFVGRVSGTRTARMPDFAYLLEGVNTDLAITNSGSPFGTDLGHEVVDQYEVGLGKRFGEVQMDAALFDDQFTKVVVTQMEPLYDPARGNIDYVLLHELATGGSLFGITLSGAWQATSWFKASGAFTHTEGSGWNPLAGGATAVDGSRPNTLSLSARLQAPASGGLRGFGALVTYRHLSGAAELIDPAFAPYPPGGAIRTSFVPAWTSLDLRIAKSLDLRSRQLTIYLDARNLLSAENLLRAFGGSDPTRSANGEGLRFSNDSSWSADEAIRGGHYDNATGDIDLTFGGAGRGGCGAWVTATGQSSPPNCAYLIAAEKRFGNSDGIYSLTEQRSASLAYYLTQFGKSTLYGKGRAIRIGAQIAF